MQYVLKAVQALPKEYPGLDVLDPTVVYLMGCMNFNQFCCTWRAIEDPILFCPFCPVELDRRRRTPLFMNSWNLFENEFPRTDTSQMLLIVPNRHLVDIRDLTRNDWQDIYTIFDVCRLQGFLNGTLLMRFGDPRDHAGTIEHLHINMISPVREGGCSLPVAKNVEGLFGHRQDYDRLRGFVATIDDKGGVGWLFSPEGIIETQPLIMA